MPKDLGAEKLGRFAERRPWDYPFDLPGADKVVRVERRLVVPIALDPDGGTT